MKYTVLKNFKDKYTNEYYGMGFTYESENAERIAELERGGYIAPEGSEMAKMGENNQAVETNQANKENHQEDNQRTVTAPRATQTKAQQLEQEAKQQAVHDEQQAHQEHQAQQAKAKAKAKAKKQDNE